MSKSPQQEAFEQLVVKEIREMRERAGLSQQAISDVFGWGRDAMSKIENGKNMPSLYQYLKIVDFLHDGQEDHPAIPLARTLLPRGRARPKLVQT